MKVGCHLSSSGGYLAMGQTAVSIGANVFQFFTRNPRGGAARPLDLADVAAFRAYAEGQGIGPVMAHAPYTLNAAAADLRVRAFAEEVMSDDLLRLSHVPGAYYNFHPGCHVGQGAEAGIGLVAAHLVRVARNVLRKADAVSTEVLFETMSGKGSELGATFAEIRALVDRTEAALADAGLAGALKLGVCLDTCHVWDGGYDVVDGLDGVLDEFDRVVGLGRLRAVHANDSMNARAAHKDRHEKIGKGKLGLEAFARLVNHPRLRDLPFYLETPCDLQGYKEEIALLKGLEEK